MATMFKWISRSWLWRGVALLALLLLPLQAFAADNSTATITLFAPGAPVGARAEVQYESPSGAWFVVTGWQSPLDAKTKDVVPVPYERWTVSHEEFGQGPFRWVIYQPDGKTQWAISDIFSLPPGGGMDRSVTIRPDNLVKITPPTTASVGTLAAELPVLKGGAEVVGVPCTGCDSHAHITAFFTGLPVTSWIAVQWQDGVGQWQSVPGWQGNATFLYSKGQLDTWTPGGTGTLFLQWSVLPANYGQGPFRWAVYDKPNGTLVAVSSNFRLPSMDGVNTIMNLSQ